MRRFCTFVIILLFAFSSAYASLDDGFYMCKQPQSFFYSTTVFSKESYPEVHITAYSLSDLFSSYSPKEPLFLCFSFPDNVLASSFDSNSAHALNTTKAIQYSYILRKKASWEEFLSMAKSEKYIIQNENNGIAVYIDPQKKKGYAMIGTTEFNKNSKLIIEICLNYLGDNMDEEKVISAVTEAILTESNRVYKEMHYETISPYWNSNTFAGIKMLDKDDNSYMVKFTFPEINRTLEDGTIINSTIIVTESKYNHFKYQYEFGNGTRLEVTIDLKNNPQTVYQLEEKKNPNAEKVTLSNGKECYIYAKDFKSGEKNYLVEYSFPLNHTDSYGNIYHLDIILSGIWYNYDEVIRDLYLFADNFEELDTEVDEKQFAFTVNTIESSEETNSSENAEWTCPECGTISSKNYCPECGTEKPAANSEWPCPNCGTINNRKFCPECGTAKP